MSCEEITENEQYRLTLHIDDEYLSDEATVYPIRIDPTINVNYSNNGEGGIRDVTVYSNNTFNGTGSDLYVGHKNGLKARTLMKFPGLSLTNIHSSLNVTSATLEMWDCGGQEEMITINCYLFDGTSWTEASAAWNNININNYPMHLSSVNIYKKNPRSFNFDITKAVKCWVDKSVSKDKGILFKAADAIENGSANTYKNFASYNRFTVKPSLKVVFTYGIIKNQYYSKYDPDKYNTNEEPFNGINVYSYLIKYRMNCYGYAFGFIVHEDGPYHSTIDGTGYKQQPGEFAFLSEKNHIKNNTPTDNPSKQMNYISENIIYDAARLGYSVQEYTPIVQNQIAQYGTTSRLVALVNTLDASDFHFYMQHNDGTWSHKPGEEDVTNKSITSNTLLTNNNIYYKANEGNYSGGTVKFFIITKNTIVDVPHEGGSRNSPPYRQPPYNNNLCTIYYKEIAGDYLETSKTLPFSGEARADHLKDHDVYCFEQATGKNYIVSAGNLTITVYNNDGAEIDPVSGYTNKYYLNGGNRYYIDVSAIQKAPQLYSFSIV